MLYTKYENTTINAAKIFEIIIKYAENQIGLDVNLEDAKMKVHVIKIKIEDIFQ
jgi:PIN domain nuclease of toxin-antitoxin system